MLIDYTLIITIGIVPKYQLPGDPLVIAACTVGLLNAVKAVIVYGWNLWSLYVC